MKVKANAKINLTLDVVRKRDDGYHELDMIMMPISLCDELDVVISDHDEIICGKRNFPLDDSNTIFKAIKLMREKYNLNQCFKVKVEKNIPMQAGLAGGSADGAAMLKAIVQLSNLEIEESELLEIGKQIGADVPFCIVNEVSRVKGIGEEITRISSNCNFYLLLVKPRVGVSTKEAFMNIDFNSCNHPNVEVIEEALKNNDYDKIVQMIGNTLESSAFKISPIIKQIKEELMAFGFDGVLMSGSGSTVFAISKDITKMKKLLPELRDKYSFVQIVDIV